MNIFIRWRHLNKSELPKTALSWEMKSRHSCTYTHPTVPNLKTPPFCFGAQRYLLKTSTTKFITTIKTQTVAQRGFSNLYLASKSFGVQITLSLKLVMMGTARHIHSRARLDQKLLLI
ncbi:hypothetical protein AAMO2058_000055200 [Amorphochlora amoebiformis]